MEKKPIACSWCLKSALKLKIFSQLRKVHHLCKQCLNILFQTLHGILSG